MKTSLAVKLITIAATVLFMAPGLVLAQSDSIDVYINGSLVTASNTPALFNISSLMPGDTEPGTVKITNNGSAWVDAAVRSVSSGNADVAKLINIDITSGATPVYSGKLFKFFTDSANGMKLSRIDPGDSAVYDFKISYGINEVELQNASVGFDLEFGIIDQGKIFSHPGGQPSSGRPGGEKLFGFNNIIGRRLGETYGAISYETTEPATGQIIYSAEGEPHVFKYNAAPLYGYAHIYPETPDGGYATPQNFTIPGLDPCKKYYFRVVAYRKNGLPTVSDNEYVIPAARDCSGGQDIPARERGGVLGASVEQGQSQNPPGRVEGASTEAPEAAAPAAAVSGNGKNINGTCSYNFPWWAYALFLLYWAAQIYGNKRTRKFWYFTAIIPVAVLVWMYLAHNGCNSWIPFAIMCLVSLALHLVNWRLAQRGSAQKSPANPKFAN